MQSTGINNEELKRRAQYMSMRGAQLAMDQADQDQTLETDHPRGSRGQLLGTILGVAVVLLVLVLLAWLRVL
jgi:hypothetical protein